MSRLWGLVVVTLTCFLLGPTVHVKADLDHLDFDTLKHAFLSAIKARFEKEVSLTNEIFETLSTRSTLANTVQALQDGSLSYFFRTNSFIRGKIAALVGMTSSDFLDFIRSQPQLTNLPPDITCPADILKTQDPGQKSAIVNWTPPVGHDAEDGVIRNVELKTSDKFPGARFWSGRTPVTYAVQDSGGRRGECTFTVEVKVIVCPVPQFDANKVKTCTSVVYLGETCTFSCREGYTLSGADTVTCADTGTYLPPVPTCDIIGCKAPELPDGGESYSCNRGYSYNSICTITCKKGYRVNPAGRPPWFEASMKCDAQGAWTATPVCEDFHGPTFTACPESLRLFADKRSNSTAATWQKPEAIDNSGFAPTIQQTGGPSNGDVLEVGPHLVTYEAEDSSHNKEKCMFFINVEVRKCHLPEQYHKRMQYDCDMGYIYGSVCNLSCSLDIEFQGSHEITCEVRNNEMNWRTPQGVPTCLEKDCVVPKSPTNAALACHDTQSGPRCTVVCKLDYVPARNVNKAGIIGCSPATGDWTYTNHPGCVKPKDPNGVQVAQMLYWKYECQEGDDMSAETNAMKDYLNQEMFFAGCSSGCKSIDVTAACELSIRKVPFITVKYKVWAPITETQKLPVAVGLIDAAAARQRDWYYTNFKSLNVRGIETNYYRARAREQSVTCGDGLLAEGNLCVPCGYGYKWTEMGCSKCPKNTYQDGTDSLHCTACTKGSYTVSDGATDSKHCREPCAPGTSSETGLQPCWECPRGQYQEHPMSTQCNSCNTGDLTAELGAISRHSCYKPPEKVVDLHVISRGETFLEAEWHEPAHTHADLVGYGINIHKVGEIPLRPEIRVDMNHTSVNITELEPGTTYFIKVFAVTDLGPGLAASVKDQTLKEHVPGENDTMTDPNACPPGQISPDGTSTLAGQCFDCPIGTFQPERGHKKCLPCNETETTWYKGAKSSDACVDNTLPRPTTATTTTTTTAPPNPPCGTGMISKTGFEPGCTSCMEGRQIVNDDRTECIWCPLIDGVFICPPKEPSME